MSVTCHVRFPVSVRLTMLCLVRWMWLVLGRLPFEWVTFLSVLCSWLCIFFIAGIVPGFNRMEFLEIRPWCFSRLASRGVSRSGGYYEYYELLLDE